MRECSISCPHCHKQIDLVVDGEAFISVKSKYQVNNHVVLGGNIINIEVRDNETWYLVNFLDNGQRWIRETDLDKHIGLYKESKGI
jgi:hypothetical protein